MNNAEISTITNDETGPFQPQGGVALPELTDLHINTGDSVRGHVAPSILYEQNEMSPPISAVSVPSDFNYPPSTEFRRASSPAFASKNRSPTITSLARPIYPSLSALPVTNLPVSASKPTRNLSPALLQRMPKEEPAKTERLEPRKLNLKRHSVEDLRRVFEERTGPANVLTKTGQ